MCIEAPHRRALGKIKQLRPVRGVELRGIFGAFWGYKARELRGARGLDPAIHIGAKIWHRGHLDAGYSTVVAQSIRNSGRRASFSGLTLSEFFWACFSESGRTGSRFAPEEISLTAANDENMRSMLEIPHRRNDNSKKNFPYSACCCASNPFPQARLSRYAKSAFLGFPNFNSFYEIAEPLQYWLSKFGNLIEIRKFQECRFGTPRQPSLQEGVRRTATRQIREFSLSGRCVWGVCSACLACFHHCQFSKKFLKARTANRFAQIRKSRPKKIRKASIRKKSPSVRNYESTEPLQYGARGVTIQCG